MSQVTSGSGNTVVVPFGMVQVSSRLYTRSSVAIVGKLAMDGSVDDDRGLMK